MLSPFQVVEITRGAAGAHAGRLLAEAGISVLKIETDSAPSLEVLPPFDRSGESLAYHVANARKAVISCDGNDRALIDRLVKRSHAFLTDDPRWFDLRSFGTTCHVHPADGVVNGAYELPSNDVLVQAASGTASVTGRLTGPPVTIGFPIGDLAPGYFSAIGILNGLLEGKPQVISVRGLDAIVSLLSYMGCCFVVSGEDVGFIGSGHPYIVPYGAFPASDGYVIVGAFTQPFWRKLCQMLGREEWAKDPRFKTFVDRRDNRDVLNTMLSEELAKQSVVHWLSKLKDADVPHAPVYSLDQAVRQPAMTAREMVSEVRGKPLLNNPVINLAGPLGERARPPEGKSWQACLEGFGIFSEERDSLLLEKRIVPYAWK